MRKLSMQTFLPQIRDYLKRARPKNVPGWSPEAHFEVQPLAQGEYNMNFLVKQGKTTWVLRVNTGSQLGLSDREQIAYEFKTLTLLTPLNVSPSAYFMDNSLRFLPFGVLGMDYLPGKHLDYRRDLADAARLFARYHQLDLPEEQNHLIKEGQPLTLSYNRCEEKLQVYLNSDLADPAIRSYLSEVLAWANEARHREAYFLSDPYRCIINTEVNNTNWIVNRDANTIHLVDWEKPLWGDPSRDLSHFRVPTTTLWKTDYRMSDEDKAVMMTVYKDALQDKHLRDTIEERTRLRDPFNCLRGVSWCARAWVQYQQNDHALINEDTWVKLKMFLDLDFLHSLFDPHMKANIT